ncbi:MAG: protease inhibitor I42 family protein [Microscillaceae bacterium]|jgi:hypothetical protein|nr:protease inhibitor I42 family protein [Microscillaceae bacterium]
MKRILLFAFIISLSAVQVLVAQIDKKTMIHLNKASKNLRLKVGQKAYFAYRLHGSVGFYGQYELGDSTVLAMIQEGSIPENPNAPEGMTGADNAQAYYIFEAKKAGTTTLILKQMFRQSEDSKKVLKIKVQ